MDEVLELDNLDKIRIDRNIRTLRNEDIPYLKHMVRVPVNALTTIVDDTKIIDRLLVDYLIACSANLMISSSEFLVGDLLDKINKRYNTDAILTLRDKTLIINIINNLYTLNELEEFSMRLESVNICLWALGFIEEINSYQKCDIESINRILFKYKSYNDLLKAAHTRSKQEILTKFDLVTRYYWAFREVEKEALAGKVNEKIVEIQNKTFEFITSYSYDSLRDKNIKIEYEKDDIEFNFEIPSYLSFERLTPGSKEIIALKNDESTYKMVFTDLGETQKEELQNRIEKNVRLFIKSGFALVGDYDLHSTLLEETIIRIIIQRGRVSFNSYYVYLSGHLIRIDSLIESYIDSRNYYETVNSKNTNLDFDIIFSIREFE